MTNINKQTEFEELIHVLTEIKNTIGIDAYHRWGSKDPGVIEGLGMHLGEKLESIDSNLDRIANALESNQQ
jgi:hypothetical protein